MNHDNKEREGESRFDYLARRFGLDYAKARFASPGYCVNTLNTARNAAPTRKRATSLRKAWESPYPLRMGVRS